MGECIAATLRPTAAVADSVATRGGPLTLGFGQTVLLADVTGYLLAHLLARIRVLLGLLRIRVLLGLLRIRVLLGLLRIRVLLGLLRIRVLLGLLLIRVLLRLLLIRVLLRLLLIRVLGLTVAIATITGATDTAITVAAGASTVAVTMITSVTSGIIAVSAVDSIIATLIVAAATISVAGRAGIGMNGSQSLSRRVRHDPVRRNRSGRGSLRGGRRRLGNGRQRRNGHRRHRRWGGFRRWNECRYRSSRGAGRGTGVAHSRRGSGVSPQFQGEHRDDADQQDRDHRRKDHRTVLTHLVSTSCRRRRIRSPASGTRSRSDCRYTGNAGLGVPSTRSRLGPGSRNPTGTHLLRPHLFGPRG